MAKEVTMADVLRPRLEEADEFYQETAVEGEVNPAGDPVGTGEFLSEDGQAVSNPWQKAAEGDAGLAFANGRVVLDTVDKTYTEPPQPQPGPQPEPEVTITLNKSSLSLEVEGTETLIATVTGTEETPVWSSSKDEVATVDQTGKVTAVASGEAVITAAVAGKSATATVLVS